jgi:hypothetical protein
VGRSIRRSSNPPAATRVGFIFSSDAHPNLKA